MHQEYIKALDTYYVFSPIQFEAPTELHILGSLHSKDVTKAYQQLPLFEMVYHTQYG